MESLYKMNILKKLISKIYSKIFPAYKYLKKLPRYQTTKIRLLGKDFYIADPLSFYCSYKEIFIDEIYKFKTKNINPKIIDLGSNYGTSLYFFMKNYPSAEITGVEADPHIFSILDKNIKEYNFKKIKILNKAVSTSIKPVRFYQEGSDGGRTNFLEGASFLEITTIQLDSLINSKVDFLKIDIEGNETEILTSSNNIKNVDNIFIEYHSFCNSRQTLNEILKKLSDNGFRYIIHTQFASKRPFIEKKLNNDMDLQLNIFATKVNSLFFTFLKITT